MTTPEQDLEATLHREIPLTRAMGLRVARWVDHELRLMLPLQGNTNHTGSIFGGSLYSAAVLAGWGWLLLRQRDAGIEDGHIVIQESSIEYPLPALANVTAVCNAPPQGTWERFEKTYRRHGRARLTLETRILLDDGREAVRFSGQYVLHK
ncbi:YiiD C-terminal domain-containing protein [Azomonas macrocytogenes]|uniref:Thioesterase domain-containing protein n=1 Tax=Azomonas macrocytogenes TaxID=69962 RepID=A0A839T3E5_AZOMA|nr:YiiD C-terminal domain-containing protein [Azomonas macrocytogenes]MBB3102874.1 thioesterase domain-containing protein [Azomonas macrocytogenes]